MWKHAQLAEFARKLPDLREICANVAQTLRKFAKLFLRMLRKFAQHLRPRLLRYRLFLSDARTSRAAQSDARPRAMESNQSRLGRRGAYTKQEICLQKFRGNHRKLHRILQIPTKSSRIEYCLADCCGKLQNSVKCAVISAKKNDLLRACLFRLVVVSTGGVLLVINGGVSQTNAGTCNCCRSCAKLAGFARNLRKSCVNLRNRFCKIYADLREMYGPLCYGTVCSLLRTEVPATAPRAWAGGAAGRSTD